MEKLKTMSDDKQKHLEFAQSATARKGQNSFIIKVWTVAFVSTSFALAAKDSSQNYVIVAFFPTIAFWFLDGYFSYQERLFRKLYDHIRQQTTVDFSLATDNVDKGLPDWAGATFSKTVAPFYGIIILTLFVVMYALK
ncbi:MAG TPA: hypothetical protein VMA13_07010 [Candidatus Saccharimonadales bacterium]|nr:hypothetical protein [Candidatus Saccharimonadales bacterium]